MNAETGLPIRLTSGGPRSLTLAVESAGRDLLCLVHGGEAHVGSVALSEWRDGRAHTRCLSAEGHREEAIARHAAHTLCAAARRSVACVAGIHFDGVSRGDIESISSEAYALARRAGERLRDDRILAELAAPGCMYGRIAAGRSRYARKFDAMSDTPVSQILETHGPEIAAGRAAGFGQAVRLFAPLYLSNACTNDCVYCGFRRSSSFERTRLTIEQAVSEASALHERGIRASTW